MTKLFVKLTKDPEYLGIKWKEGDIKEVLSIRPDGVMVDFQYILDGSWHTDTFKEGLIVLEFEPIDWVWDKDIVPGLRITCEEYLKLQEQEP